LRTRKSASVFFSINYYLGLPVIFKVKEIIWISQYGESDHKNWRGRMLIHAYASA